MSFLPRLTTERDEEVLRPLVFEYRLTTAADEARRLKVSLTTARKRLDRLCIKKRLLVRLSAWVAEIPPIDGPLVVWEPGDDTPDFYALAYAVEKRWQKREPLRTSIYCASSRLVTLCALPPRKRIVKEQATHDLAVGRVRDWAKTRYPELKFRGEETYQGDRGFAEKVEDGQLLDGAGIRYAVEWFGRYRAERIMDFHDAVSERNIAYLGF